MKPPFFIALGLLMAIDQTTLHGAERTAPLLTLSDLSDAGKGITQGATTTSSGAILYPEQILAVDIPSSGSGDGDARIAAWRANYRFLVVPLDIAIQANPGSAPRSVKINATFRTPPQVARQPMIVSIFPTTAFKAEPFQGEASVGLSADFKLDGGAPANASGSLKTALSYKYAPAFANVQSGYAASTCFWQFVASQSEQPVGALPLKLTVGVPNTIDAKSLALAVDIVVGFGSGWWGDEARATVVAEVLMP